MFYTLKSFVFIRNNNNYLAIIDTRNDTEIIGDYSSYLFAKNLSYSPQDIDTITSNIANEFSGEGPFEVIRRDAIDFFSKLVDFGLVSMDEKFESLNKRLELYVNKNAEKILLPKEELNKYHALKKQNPCLQNIIVEITKKCNERCLHCYIPHETKNVIMAERDFYDIVDQCVNMGTVVNFRISGGECMTHPFFKKFIRYVKEKGFSLSVLTNLTLLDDEIVQILRKGTLSKVQVSMFSTDEKIHDTMTTVPGSLKTTMRNLEKLYEAGIPVDIATQVMELNKDSIEDLYKYADAHAFKLKCDWAIIAEENRCFENLSCRVCDLSAYKAITKIKLNYMPGYKQELKDELLRAPKSEEIHLCNAGTNGLQIDTNLEIHPCPGWDFSLGNLRDIKLKDVWMSSEKLQKIRDVVLRDFPKCAKCDIRNLCSICMAQADLEMKANNFTFEMPEYTCNMYKVIYETIKEEVLDKK
ncbi:MAG: radical SAM protein [Treponema sp.]|nr:radical SAM protein [Treponema sp.]